jgi:hypothetical protein
VRRWNEYMIGLRYHPFLVSIERHSKGIFLFLIISKDVLLSIDSDSPRHFGDDKSEWSFSATGNLFAYTRQYDETNAAA